MSENACINCIHSHACALVGYQIETDAIVSQLASSVALSFQYMNHSRAGDVFLLSLVSPKDWRVWLELCVDVI